MNEHKARLHLRVVDIRSDRYARLKKDVELPFVPTPLVKLWSYAVRSSNWDGEFFTVVLEDCVLPDFDYTTSRLIERGWCLSFKTS